MKKLTRIGVLIALTIIGGVLLVACAGEPSEGVKTSQQVQDEIIADAFQAVPAYQPTSFPAREAINWHLQQTEKAELWYVYALNWEGDVVFYLTSKFRPQSVCVGITAGERLERIKNVGYFTVKAPSLSGVYRGNDSCTTFFVQDNLTGNLIEISGETFTIVASTVPLTIETDSAIELTGVLE